MDASWEDHVRRIDVTSGVISDICCEYEIHTAADLSCGDGHWRETFPTLLWRMGDFAPGYEFTGPIEETIEELDPVDLFICCETLEHLDRPDDVLKQIRAKAKFLVLSTPNSTQWDENPEHYWAWDKEAVMGMLGEAGWSGFILREANAWGDHTRVNGYAFQIWGCR